MSKMLRLSAEQLQDMLSRHKGRVHALEGERPSQAKYRNKRFRDEHGVLWDSIKEYRRWQDLRLLETAGKIERLEKKVTFDLLPPAMKEGKRMRPIRYVADFVYFEEGMKVVEDAKGFRNELYKLKKRLMWQLLGIEIYET